MYFISKFMFVSQEKYYVRRICSHCIDMMSLNTVTVYHFSFSGICRSKLDAIGGHFENLQ